jgi:hypothetical protein
MPLLVTTNAAVPQIGAGLLSVFQGTSRTLNIRMPISSCQKKKHAEKTRGNCRTQRAYDEAALRTLLTASELYQCSLDFRTLALVNLKINPIFGKNTRRAVDLTDTMTDAQMPSLDLNAANSRFTGNSGRTIRKIPKGAQHAWAVVNEAAARRVLSNRGKPEYARRLMSLLPMACLQPPTKAEKAAKITLTDKILTNISQVLRGDFSSFDAVPDGDRVRAV